MFAFNLTILFRYELSGVGNRWQIAIFAVRLQSTFFGDGPSGAHLSSGFRLATDTVAETCHLKPA
jgi:hypothetical protein